MFWNFPTLLVKVFFANIVESDFMPHGHCYFWQTEMAVPSESTSQVFQRPDKAVVQINRTIQNLTEVSGIQQQRSGALAVGPSELEEVEANPTDIIERSRATVEADFMAQPVRHINREHLKSTPYNLLTKALKYRQPNCPPHKDILRV